MRVGVPSEGALFADDGPLATRVLRRVRGIALEVLLFAVVTVLLPVLLLGAGLVDLALWLRERKPWVGVRLVAFLWWFLFGEMRALVGLLAIWLATGGPFGPGRCAVHAGSTPCGSTGRAATSGACGSCSACASTSRGSSTRDLALR